MIGIPIAAELGHVEIAETIIDHVIDSNPRDIMKRTPLHYAAMNGHLEIVILLIPVICTDMNTEDELGETPISYATFRGHYNIARTIATFLSE